MSDQFPTYRAQMEYVCLGCGARHPIDELLYTCPSCGGVFLLEDTTFDKLKEHGGAYWRNLFDSRAATRNTALRGVFRFYELMAPVLEQEDILYLGEGNTPVVDGAPELQKKLNASFAFKNDGQNPSASFKDRGMACAYSYLRALVRKHGWDEVLTICASTGDTSAAAALYGAYVGHPIKTAVLLPQGKVTPQQLSQPLGSGATVLDTRTELIVQEAFDRLMEGRTSFIVAHRLSTIRNADEILVMKDGSIIEQGTHDELIAKGGFYHTLYNSQFAKVSE